MHLGIYPRLGALQTTGPSSMSNITTTAATSLVTSPASCSGVQSRPAWPVTRVWSCFRCDNDALRAKLTQNLWEGHSWHGNLRDAPILEGGGIDVEERHSEIFR